MAGTVIVLQISLFLLGETVDVGLLDEGESLPRLDVLDGLGAEVLRSNFEEPLRLDFEDGAHVVLLGEDEFVVEDVLGAVGEDGAGVDDDHLGVLGSEVDVVLLEEGDLREVAGEDALLDGDGVDLERDLVLHEDVELLDNGLELVADVEHGLEVTVVEEVLVAPVHVLVLPLVLEERVHERQVVAVLADELALRVARLHHLVLRPQEDVRRVQAGHDREDFVHAVVLRGGHQHLRQLRLQRELRHLLALRREVALVVQRPQVVQQLQGAHERFGGRGVHEVEVHQVVDAQLLQGEDCGRQVGPEDLGVGVLDEFLVVGLLSVESEALARLGPAGAARPLLGAGLADGGHQETLHPHAGVEHLLLGEPRVDHVDDAVDGDTGLGDVGGHDDLPALDALLAGLGRVLEDPLLLVRGQRAVERDDGHRPHLLAQLLDLLLDFAAGSLDLLLPGQEQQDVALALVLVDGDCSPDGGLHVVGFGLLAEVDVDGVHPAGDVEPRRPAEVLLELDCVHGGRHHDQLEVGASRQDLLDESEQHVRVEGALVGLIQDDHRVPLQVGVDHRLPQQHPVSHVLQDRPPRSQVLEADRVAHLLAQLHVQLLAHSFGHRHGRHPSWLRAGDALLGGGVAGLDEELGDLRGLAGTGLSDEDEDLVLLEEGEQFGLGVEGGESASGLQELVVVVRVGLGVEVVGVCLYFLREGVLGLFLGGNSQFLAHKLKQ